MAELSCNFSLLDKFIHGYKEPPASRDALMSLK